MNVTIENLTDKPLWVRLNSGASLGVMPRSSQVVSDGEVRGNAKLRRLHDERMIRTRPPYGEPEGAKASDPKAGKDAEKKKEQ